MTSSTNDQIEELTQQFLTIGTRASTTTDPSSRTHNPVPQQHNDDDPGMWRKLAMDQLKSLQTSISVPLFSVVPTFEGNPKQFKQWTRNVERYAQLADLREEDIPKIAHVTCIGLVADFIKRYLDEIKTIGETAKWQDLKKLLQKRFAEITDDYQAMAMMRRMKQQPGESVQMYAERMLSVAEDAYPAESGFDRNTHDLIQKQMVDSFCDGLYHDYLRMKVMREDPKTFDQAVNSAMKEQDLRRRFNERKEPEHQKVENQNWGPRLNQQYNPFRVDQRQIEPMELGHMRDQNCFKCGKPGHWAKNCRKINYQAFLANDTYREPVPMSDEDDEDMKSPKPKLKSVRKKEPQRNTETGRRKVPTQRQEPTKPAAQPNQVPDWIKGAECWICHMIGHLKRNCPNRSVPDRNRIKLYPRGVYKTNRPTQQLN